MNKTAAEWPVTMIRNTQQYAKEQTASERSDDEQAEFNAKIHRVGLWNSKNPLPAWASPAHYP